MIAPPSYRSPIGALLFMALLSSCGLFSGISGGDDDLNVDVPKGRKELTQKDSMRLRAVLIEANKEKMIGNDEQALKTFRKGFKIDSALPSVHYEIARILREKKERSKALEHAKKAVALDRDNEWYRKFLAELYVEYGSYSRAAKVYGELLEEDDSELELSYRYADALIRAGKHKKAITVYDSIEARMGMQPRVTLQKQRLYQRLGKQKKALEEVKGLVERYPDRARYYGALAQLYQQMGKDDQALKAYENLLERDPDNGKAHLSISRFYQNRGKTRKAFDHLGKGFKSPGLGIDRKVKVLLDLFERSQNDPGLKERSYELLDILVKAHPDEAKAYTVYGDFLLRDGKNGKARKMFKKAVSLDAGRFPIWQQILLLDQRMGDMDSLLADSREAKEYFPNQPKVYLFEGIALSRQERYKEALDPLKYGKSLVVDNDGLEYRFLKRLGEAYYRQKDYDASYSAFEGALGIRSDDPFLLNNYAYYLSTQKDSLSKALKMSKRANELEPGRPSFLDTYGWILYQKGAHQKARKKLKEAIDQGGRKSGTILEHYGDVLFRTGDESRALEYWKKARDAGGGSEELEQKIREEELPTP